MLGESNKPSQEPLALGNNIFLLEACSNESKSSLPYSEKSTPPSLIIICTWLGGATISRITKYTSHYQNIYPSASILLIRTVIQDITTRSSKTIRARLSPAREAISRILERSQQHKSGSTSKGIESDVLLHIFSNGGCNIAVQLAISMYEASGTLLHDHLRQIVFECCPGDTTLEQAYTAALTSMPSQANAIAPIRIVASAAVYSTVAIILGLQNAGLMFSFGDMRAHLNNSTMFGTRACRLYLYSTADRIVGVADVESHAQNALEKGYQVSKVVFTAAVHCGLVLEDAKKYWGSIEESWAKWPCAEPLETNTNSKAKL